MKNLKTTLLSVAFLSVGAGSVGCGQIGDLLDSNKGNTSSVLSEEDEASKLINDSVSRASGSSEEFLHPYSMEGLEKDSGKPEDLRPGQRGGHAPRGGHGPKGGHGPHRGHGIGKGIKGPPPALPADILALMKAADAKKDAVLGIERVKVEEILKNMRTDLEAARSVAASREDFVAQAKVIQDKYVAQLKAVLPSFESLTQEQKSRVKAIHDLQKGVITACVAHDADSTGAACTASKSALQANIDAP